MSVKQVIRFTQREEAKALPILLRHSPGKVVGDRTYVLAAEAVAALLDAGVRFEEVNTERDAPDLAGAADGVRDLQQEEMLIVERSVGTL
jgi:hypothetical protein